jgi:hypothetical protein
LVVGVVTSPSYPKPNFANLFYRDVLQDKKHSRFDFTPQNHQNVFKFSFWKQKKNVQGLDPHAVKPIEITSPTVGGAAPWTAHDWNGILGADRLSATTSLTKNAMNNALT